MPKATMESENWFDEYISQAIKDNIRNIKKLFDVSFNHSQCFLLYFFFRVS